MVPTAGSTGLLSRGNEVGELEEITEVVDDLLGLLLGQALVTWLRAFRLASGALLSALRLCLGDCDGLLCWTAVTWLATLSDSDSSGGYSFCDLGNANGALGDIVIWGGLGDLASLGAVGTGNAGGCGLSNRDLSIAPGSGADGGGGGGGLDVSTFPWVAGSSDGEAGEWNEAEVLHYGGCMVIR